MFNANNSKDSWEAIDALLNQKSKSTQVTQLNVDDQVITGDRNIAHCFNQYFSSIGCKLSDNIQKNNIDLMAFVTPVESSLHFSCISAVKVLSALNQLNSRKSPGLDGISVKLLKDTSDVIAQPITKIFNISHQTGSFPDDWKIAQVSPYHTSIGGFLADKFCELVGDHFVEQLIPGPTHRDGNKLDLLIRNVTTSTPELS